MGVIKYFVSHARDKYGGSHIHQVQYFPSIHSLGDNYGLRGVHKRVKKVQASGHCFIVTVQFRMVQNYKDHSSSNLND